jgi:DNA helicase II / ATP-dependent DNA helicase PcrA
LAKNKAIIAVAGSRKTETVIEEALEDTSQRTLITTYTLENLAQIVRRIEARVGVVPSTVTVMSWFSFLMAHAVRPYQYSVLGEIDFVRGLNFLGEHGKFVRKLESQKYFLDSNHDIYRNGVSDFACSADAASGGAVVGRLEQCFDRICIDEVQDLVAYDLEFLDLLLRSQIDITVVGDPRQFTLETNTSQKNRKYRGPGLVKWLKKRSDLCTLEERCTSDRCNQQICDFASSIFPELEPLRSRREPEHGPNGIHLVTPSDLVAYAASYRPQVLRWNRTANTRGLDAINIGVSKGSTYEHVLIFPTTPMKKFLGGGDIADLKAREKLYVAVTRACHSVGFVIGS